MARRAGGRDDGIRGRRLAPGGVALACALLCGTATGAVAQTGVAPDDFQQPVAATDADADAEPGAVAVRASPGDREGTPAPTPARADGYRSEIEAAWFAGGPDLTARAQGARRAALRLGASNVESAARALLVADGSDDEKLERARLAAVLAPDVPAVRLALALALIRSGEYPDVLPEAVAGLVAIPRNFEASLWLFGTLVATLATVLVVGSMLFIVWIGASEFRHAAHDLGDLISSEMPDFARAALLASLMLVPVALGEALMGITLSFFALGFAYAKRRPLVLAAVLLVVGLYPGAHATGIAVGALHADAVATAADAVVRGIESPVDVELLASVDGEDPLAEAALALRERRMGNREAAMARYAQLETERPSDPTVLAALANMHFERGDNERAIQLAERAASATTSPTLLFDLSQIYARTFRMSESENAMAHAQRLDRTTASDLASTSSAEFVADLPFDVWPIWRRLIEPRGDASLVATTSRLVMPGRLGEEWRVTAGAFALTALFAVILAGRFDHASTCGRCGDRICARCDGTVWNSEVCDGCHHLFHRPDSTDPKMRLARLSALRARERRVDRIAVLSSLLVPGVAGLLARRPGLSFLGLFFFTWGVALLVWGRGIVVDPLAVGAAGPLALSIVGAFVTICYASVVTAGLRARRSL